MKNMDTKSSLMNIIRFIYIITAHIVYLYKSPFFIQVGVAENDFWVCLNDVIPLLTRFIQPR